MEKQELDNLYHLLRVASNDLALDTDEFKEQRTALLGIVRHLLQGSDYLGLIQYSAYYGEQFLVRPTYEAMVHKGWKPTRIVDLGAGLGWLSRGLSLLYGASVTSTLTVDKRSWGAIDLPANLETSDGIWQVISTLKDKDVIVMSDLLHCLNNPREILSAFSKWPMAILEYCSARSEYAYSYCFQLERYGASFLPQSNLIQMLHEVGRPVETVNLEPYILTLIDPEQ
jgi:hypothetical protein